MRIAVLGGTGVVGRHVVAHAAERGHETSVLSRSCGVDVATGAGLAEALVGADVAIDVTNIATLRRSAATRFFDASARSLQAAAARSGVPQIVVLSIVGIDRLRQIGYYDAKLTQERLHLAGPVEATVLRATQFHEFPMQVAARARLGPVTLVPSLRVQTVAASSVAALLVTAATAGPHRGRLPDVAGPGPAALLDDLTRASLARAGSRTRVLGVPLAGATRRASEAGALLPAPDATVTGPSFCAWLDGPEGPGGSAASR